MIFYCIKSHPTHDEDAAAASAAVATSAASAASLLQLPLNLSFDR